MGRKELEALAVVIQQQLALGADGVIAGTWSIHFDRERGAFQFDKCEFAGYCEERPSVISTSGDVLDAGGPLLQGA